MRISPIIHRSVPERERNLTAGCLELRPDGAEESHPRERSCPDPSAIICSSSLRRCHSLCQGNSPSGNSRTSIDNFRSPLWTYNRAFLRIVPFPELTKVVRNLSVKFLVTIRRTVAFSLCRSLVGSEIA